MIEFNAPVIAIFVVILGSLLGLAVGWGTLRERVKNNRHDIDQDRDDRKGDRKENSEAHERIYDKIDETLTAVRNGGGKA